MTLWHLLWMFVSANGFFILLLLTPLLVAYASSGEEQARWRAFAWFVERRRRREVALYGRPLEPCLYCGSKCDFGEGCANRGLAAKAVMH